MSRSTLRVLCGTHWTSPPTMLQGHSHTEYDAAAATVGLREPMLPRCARHGLRELHVPFGSRHLFSCRFVVFRKVTTSRRASYTLCKSRATPSPVRIVRSPLPNDPPSSPTPGRRSAPTSRRSSSLWLCGRAPRSPRRSWARESSILYFLRERTRREYPLAAFARARPVRGCLAGRGRMRVTGALFAFVCSPSR